MAQRARMAKKQEGERIILGERSGEIIENRLKNRTFKHKIDLRWQTVGERNGRREEERVQRDLHSSQMDSWIINGTLLGPVKRDAHEPSSCKRRKSQTLG